MTILCSVEMVSTQSFMIGLRNENCNNEKVPRWQLTGEGLFFWNKPIEMIDNEKQIRFSRAPGGNSDSFVCLGSGMEAATGWANSELAAMGRRYLSHDLHCDIDNYWMS